MTLKTQETSADEDRSTKRELQKLNLRLYKEDVEDFKDFFPNMHLNATVRSIFALFMNEKRVKIQGALQNVKPDLELGPIGTPIKEG